MDRGQFLAAFFFGGAVLCLLNPAPFPVGDWAHVGLDRVFGWMR